MCSDLAANNTRLSAHFGRTQPSILCKCGTEKESALPNAGSNPPYLRLGRPAFSTFRCHPGEQRAAKLPNPKDSSPVRGCEIYSFEKYRLIGPRFRKQLLPNIKANIWPLDNKVNVEAPAPIHGNGGLAADLSKGWFRHSFSRRFG